MTTLEQPPLQAAGTVLDPVWARVREHPGATALIDVDGTEITYGEFGARCDALAGHLLDAGVRPDEPVVVRLGRSAEAIVAMVAVMRAGGVYTPVDGWPPARYAAVVRQTGASWLVGDREPPPEAAAAGLRLLPQDGAPAPAADVRLDPGNLAYILHTSGSSGTPKGVAMTHRGLARLIGWQAGDGPPGLTTAVFTPVGFDVVFQEVFSTLATGGRLCVLSEPDRMDPERLLDVLDRRSVQRIFLPYVALQRLAKAAERLGRAPSALRHVITAGSGSSSPSPSPGCSVRCRDAASTTTTARPRPTSSPAGPRGRAEDWPQMPPIGAPVPGADVHLLDDDLRPVPAYEPGEVYVSGASLARGYTNAPALTAGGSCPTRSHRAPGCTGRATSPPGTAAARCASSAGWRRAGQGARLPGGTGGGGARPRPAPRGPGRRRRPPQAGRGRRRAGRLRGGRAPGVPVAELSDGARATLPPYMLPSRYVFLDALPLTATGKIDRAALAATELPATDLPGEEERATGSRSTWWRGSGGGCSAMTSSSPTTTSSTWAATRCSRPGWSPSWAGRAGAEALGAAGRQHPGRARRDPERPRHPARGGAQRVRDPHAEPGPCQPRAVPVPHARRRGPRYRELARTLTAPLRVLGVRWAEDGYGGRSLEELAAVHTARIRDLQPEGPYLLAGWSFGGVLAFEVAAQLTAAAEVAFLGLLDANPLLDPITGLPPGRTTYHDMLTRVLDRLDRSEAADEPVDVSALAADADWAGLMGAVPAGRHRPAPRAPPVARAGGHARGLGVPAERPPRRDRAVPGYATGADVRRRLLDRLRDVTAGPVHAHVVPGDHAGILRGANAAALAGALDGALGRLAKEGSDAA